MSVLFLHATLRAKGRHRGSYELAGDTALTMDVRITCYGGDVSVVMDTITGVASQDYPHQTFQVFVVDDAQSDEPRRAINEHNKKD